MNYFFDDNISETSFGIWKKEIDLLKSWYDNEYYNKLIEFYNRLDYIDLYIITKESKYEIKHEECKNIRGRKNILIDYV